MLPGEHGIPTSGQAGGFGQVHEQLHRVGIGDVAREIHHEPCCLGREAVHPVGIPGETVPQAGVAERGPVRIERAIKLLPVGAISITVRVPFVSMPALISASVRRNTRRSETFQLPDLAS